MQTVVLEKAQATLADLLKQVADGEEFTITQNGEPKARLSAVPTAYRKNGILVHHAGRSISAQDVAKALTGNLEGKIEMSPDFDAPLDDFKDYMK
jgi:prevent-host-death family protein